MAISEVVVTQRAFAAAPQRGVATRLLEDERWLAAALLLPTVILLGLFIAYPFAEGVWLSVIDARVGVPGHFVGLANFVMLWNDSIFRVAVWNTFVYTAVATVFKLGLGLWLALLAEDRGGMMQYLHSRRCPPVKLQEESDLAVIQGVRQAHRRGHEYGPPDQLELRVFRTGRRGQA